MSGHEDPSDITEAAARKPLPGRELAASLTVRDVQESLAWYRDVLGFEVDRTFERDGALMAASLRAGDVRLLLGQDDGAKGWDRTKGVGLSLQITISGDIDEVARRVEESGGVFETRPTDTPWGRRIFRLLDPDGFKLTISSEPQDESG